ncbi:MAG TPA: site-specific integrase [Phycisphaerae bacterium]|nr:site-specific integrase [Phycisphaerae bacterium]
MATVYRKKIIRPMPEGAEIVTQRGMQLARWQNGDGRRRTAEVAVGRDGVVRIATRTATYYARYRDGSGHRLDVPTGCRDETAARAVLADLVRRSELVKANVITPKEDVIANHQDTPLLEHMEAWLAHLEAKGVTPGRVKTNRQRFMQVAGDCDFTRLSDLDGANLERWMVEKRKEGMSAGSRNGYREACVGFANWAVRSKRLGENPFAYVPKADAKADCRRKRRALTEEELVRLLDATRRRPLLEAMTVHRGKDKGKTLGKLKPRTRERLERLGRERALIYKTLVLTGLRKSELASISVGQTVLDGPFPHLALYAADEKNRQGSNIPLRADLVTDIREWLVEKLLAVQQEALRHRQPPPKVLPPETPVFTVPAALVKILNRDLELAGIPKKDGRGWTVDVHAMRHTFGTLLSRGNVAPRTAQAAMRHSSIDLTMNVYTDPQLLDVAGALDALPGLPLGSVHPDDRQGLRPTGTDRARR